MEKDPVLENMMNQLGEFGSYQLRQHLLHLLTSFLAGIHMLALTFTAPVPESRCFIPQVDSSNASLADLYKYIPINPEEDSLDTCLKFKTVNNIVLTNETVSCEGHYFYDSTYYSTSRVIEWDLVCDKRWMRALLQSIYMAGVLSGAVTMGSLADSYGRKPILYISGVLQLLFGLTCAFMPNYYLYAVTLFLYGAFGSGGAYVTGFVLSMELVGASRRTVCGVMFSVTFSVGEMLVSFWAWQIPNARLLQIIYAAHSILLLGHWWLVDESIRWLWGQGRQKEAMDICSRAVAINGQKFVDSTKVRKNAVIPPYIIRENSISSISTDNTEQMNTPHSGVLDLIRLPTLRFRAINMAYNWFANSLVYYGLAFNMGTLPANPILMNFLNGLAEVPGTFLVIMLLDRTGRRPLGSLLLFLGGFACIVLAFVPKGTFVITLAMLAKTAVAGSFAICFNYAAEMFPTVIRNSVIGITTMAARAAGMLAPEIILLDSIGKAVPTIVFGTVAILAAFFGLFLPETMNKEMPQTMEDGENFGKGDTAFRSVWRLYKRRRLSVISRSRLR